MLDLAKKALERMKSGGNRSSEDQAHPLKEAMKEAFDAAQEGDFDRYFNAFESALDIRLAQMGTDSGEDELEQ